MANAILDFTHTFAGEIKFVIVCYGVGIVIRALPRLRLSAPTNLRRVK